VLQEPRVAAVVLRGDDDERVGAIHRLRELGILRRLARVVGADGQRGDVDQSSLDTCPVYEL
jgi:hypothetical protein